MIDIHSHIIPGVDDGSPDMKSSLVLVRNMAEQGVTDVICTPHYRKPYNCTVEEITKRFNELKAAVKEQGIPVNLYLGQEIYCRRGEYKELISSGKVMPLNGSKFILLEFDFEVYSDIADVVYEVKAMGYQPIVAHIERYSYMTDEDVFEIKKVGGLIQVNASSVVGSVGRRIKKTIKKLYREGFVDFVASDVHEGRANDLLKAYEYVKRKFGEDAAEVTFNVNAKRILKG
ncbi:MAG: CpsB/CapC family capsule biosynthesis tyrosine phosphatase [Clostridia bacterium]|nr:CpsB/CapC family capsule biosynthesis tyrosine phosphatase [Clostridia bacterium]